MIEVKQEQVGNSLIRETCGIVTRLVCAKCGENLPLFEWDCPHYNKATDGDGDYDDLEGD